MLAALCLAMVFAISLSSYIAMCYVSLGVSTRNVMNARCSELAESGIEQALYAQNNNDWSGWTATTVGAVTTEAATMTMTSTGLQTGAVTPMNFGNNTTGLANITVTLTSGVLTSIASQGEVQIPNGSATNTSAITQITRTLTVNGAGATGSSSAPVFVNAVAATSGRVTFTGGTFDSYNSGAYPGPYSLYSVGGFSAIVLSQDIASLTATVRLSGAQVDGYVVGYDYGSPSSTNWLSYSGTGKLKGPNTLPATFIDSTRILSTPVPFQPIFPENLPNGTANLPLAACPGNNVLTYTYTLTPQVYYASGINLASGKTVTITGNTVIIVYGNVTMAGTATIKINSGASLAIFAENGSVNINCTGANTGIYNASAVPLAKNFTLLSTNNTSSFNTVKLTQASPFYGVVYFPYLKITIGTTGAAAPMYGSVVGSAVTFNGAAPVFHYDNALRHPDSIIGDVAFTYVTAPSTVSSFVASVP
jgi:hypothetical protein